jgi:3',5'-cyclic AMP phosphodiesterase CpdA
MRDITYLAIITDQHVVEPGSTLYGLDTESSTRALCDLLSREVVPLAGIVCLGDLADTVRDTNRMTAVATREAYAHARELLSPLPSTFLSLPGNHDDPNLMSEIFPTSWDTSKSGISCASLSGFTLIGIDVRTGPEPTGSASPETILALDEALHAADRAILLSHYPLFDLDNERIDNELSTLNRKEIQRVIHRHSSKISACFHGHLHIWITGYQDGMLTHSVPSSSFTFILEPQGNIMETVGNQPCGYLLLGLGKDGSIIVRPRFLPPAQRVAKHA